jgi:hypothetical protein
MQTSGAVLGIKSEFWADCREITVSPSSTTTDVCYVSHYCRYSEGKALPERPSCQVEP